MVQRRALIVEYVQHLCEAMGCGSLMEFSRGITKSVNTCFPRSDSPPNPLKELLNPS